MSGIRYKVGGVTTHIDGHELPGAKAARESMRPRFAGVASGDFRAKFVTPDPDVRKLAEFAATVARRHHGAHTMPPVAVKFFAGDGARHGFAPDDGPAFVAVAADLKDEALVRTALHEVRHLAQRGVAFSGDADREADAQAYAAKWAALVLKAAHWTDCEASRVTFTPGRSAPAADHGRNGDVAISRTHPRAWLKNTRATSATWLPLT